MLRRTFCQSTLAAAVSAALPGCGSEHVDAGTRIPAISREGGELSLELAAVRDFGDSLVGRLFLQADAGYDDAKRVWNGMFDHRQPAMVVQCANTADVVSAVPEYRRSARTSPSESVLARRRFGRRSR